MRGLFEVGYFAGMVHLLNSGPSLSLTFFDKTSKMIVPVGIIVFQQTKRGKGVDTEILGGYLYLNNNGPLLKWPDQGFY